MSDRVVFEAIVDGRSTDLQRLLALGIAQTEYAIEAHVTQGDPTDKRESGGQRYTAYFDLLTSLGYTTASCERVLCGREKAVLAEKPKAAKKPRKKAADAAQEPASGAAAPAEGSEPEDIEEID